MQNIERLLIAPDKSRFYLILKNGVESIQNFLICFLYIDFWIMGRLPFTAAWIQCSWLLIFFIANLVLSILNVLFIPSLITLKQQKQKRQQIMQLRLLLSYKLYNYLTITSLLVAIFYVIGFIVIIFDIIFGETNEEAYTIRTFVRWTIGMNIIKYFCFSIPLEKKLESTIIEESLKSFIRGFLVSQQSELVLQDCPICYEQFQIGDQVAEYLCKGRHAFHKECVVKWLNMSNNKHKICPYCKQTPDNFAEFM